MPKYRNALTFDVRRDLKSSLRRDAVKRYCGVLLDGGTFWGKPSFMMAWRSSATF